MKIYHTETQADYDALMVELEEQGCTWLSGDKPTSWNDWSLFVKETCVRLDDDTITQSFKSFYDGRTPITKYKAKADDKMKFTKENVYRLFGDYRRGKNGINRLDNLESVIMDLDDKPEKAVVPKCFDEWYQEITLVWENPEVAKRFALWKICQQGFGYGFKDVGNKDIPYDSDLGKWLKRNKMLAIDAVLNGYTIEPEQLYYIPLPSLETSDGLQQVLSKRKGDKNYFACRPNDKLKQRFTKAELEQVPEIYKQFAKPVEEAGE